MDLENGSGTPAASLALTKVGNGKQMAKSAQALLSPNVGPLTLLCVQVLPKIVQFNLYTYMQLSGQTFSLGFPAHFYMFQLAAKH